MSSKTQTTHAHRAAALARGIFEHGDETDHRVQRIEFKAGTLSHERPLSGLNETALATLLARLLEETEEPPITDVTQEQRDLAKALAISSFRASYQAMPSNVEDARLLPALTSWASACNLAAKALLDSANQLSLPAPTERAFVGESISRGRQLDQVKRWSVMKFNSEGWDSPVNEIGVFRHERGEFVKFFDYESREGELLADLERVRALLDERNKKLVGCGRTCVWSPTKDTIGSGIYERRIFVTGCEDKRHDTRELGAPFCKYCGGLIVVEGENLAMKHSL